MWKSSAQIVVPLIGTFMALAVDGDAVAYSIPQPGVSVFESLAADDEQHGRHGEAAARVARLEEFRGVQRIVLVLAPTGPFKQVLCAR